MKKLSTSKQIAINMVAAIVSFLIGTGINFVLAPYLVKELGSETYGFIGLANNFVQYATIVTSALNSMSGRFISIEYSKGNIDKASRYFSSVLVADLIIAGVLLLVSSIITFNIEFILNVPENLVDSVKILFAFTFATFIIRVLVYYMDMPQVKAAELMGINLRTLHSLLHRAKNWIKKNYKAEYEEMNRED